MTISVIIDSNVTCAGYANGGATIIASGGNGSYTYAWSSGDTTQSVSNLSGGSYIAAAFDSIGCSINTAFTITEPFSVDASANVTQQISCNRQTNGAAAISATGGTPPYSFLWSNGSTNSSLSSLSAATYSVTVFDSLGCTDMSSVEIINPDTLLATLVIDSLISCNGAHDAVAQVVITGGTTPYTTTWSNSFTGLVNSGLGAGTYDVQVIDAHGCIDSSSITITEPSILSSSILITNQLDCFGDSNATATVSASGGWPSYSFGWSNGSDSSTAQQLHAQTYYVSITDSGGCQILDSVLVESPAELLSTLTITQNISCYGFSDGEIHASANQGTPPYTYAWNTGATTEFISGLMANLYLVSITDSNNCFRTDSMLLDQPDSIAPMLSVENVLCEGSATGAAEISSSGGTPPYSFIWSNGDSGILTTNLSEGIISVTTTDANSCISIVQDSISFVFPAPPLFIGADTTICENDSITLTVSNATVDYLWSTGATAQSITTSEEGLYWVQIADSNGCENTDSIFVSMEICIGINEQAQLINAHIQPNPNNGNFSLILDKSSSGLLEVYTATGKLVFSKKYIQQRLIDVQFDADAGFYLVLFKSERGNFIQKILIQ